MGYETYAFVINIDYNESIINQFNNIGYIITKNDNHGLFMGKIYKHGMIELLIAREYILNDITLNSTHKIIKISARSLKSNDPFIIDEFMNDIKTLNIFLKLTLYDLNLKEFLNLTDYSNLKNNYITQRKEFLKYFPN